MSQSAAEPLSSPEGRGGLGAVLRERYLLTLLVRKELRVRYRGSVLGLFWSYVKPAVQFVVFYFAVGVFLGLNKAIEDFAVYLFSGVVIVNFFSEALGNATRSVVANAPLVKKVWLPRELFPVASLVVALVHLLPQVIVLLVGAIIVGWRPSVIEVALGVGAVVLTGLFALALALLLGAINVFYRDFENVVDLLLMVATWMSPVLYPWTAVRDVLGEGPLLSIYLSNPLTVAVNGFHRAVWYPGTTTPSDLPPLLGPGLVGLGITLVLLVVGQLTFSRLQRRFAQEL